MAILLCEYCVDSRLLFCNSFQVLFFHQLVANNESETWFWVQPIMLTHSDLNWFILILLHKIPLQPHHRGTLPALGSQSRVTCSDWITQPAVWSLTQSIDTYQLRALRLINHLTHLKTWGRFSKSSSKARTFWIPDNLRSVRVLWCSLRGRHSTAVTPYTRSLLIP